MANRRQPEPDRSMPERAAAPEIASQRLELTELIDLPGVQALMEDFYGLTRIPMSLIDLRGKVMVGVGWQRICTQYHRKHPESCRHCLESDTVLSANIPPGRFRLYKCKNHMWDVATPLFIGGQHVANVFSGQFFLTGENLDREFFRRQARRYGFPEDQYLAALDAVPRLSREAVEMGMVFLTKLAQMLSRLGYSNLGLADALRERDQLMATLREHQRDLNRAQAVARTGSWRLNVQRNELVWSDETYRLFGIVRGTALTYESFLASVHPDDRKLVDCCWQAALKGAPYDIEHRIIVGEEVRWVRERAELEFDRDGALCGGFGTVQDITERKHLELALRYKEALLSDQANRLEQTVLDRTAKLQEMVSELEHYSYSITHDLRAPLRAMQGFAAMLLEDCGKCLNEERLDLLRRISSASQRMDRLIRDALNYNCAVRNELPLAPIDLATLLRGIVDSYPDLRQPGVQIEVANGMPSLLGNEAALTQCFANLLVNAAKFVAPGVAPRIRVWAEDRGAMIRVWVKDNGIGIPPEWQERIFQMFQRRHAEYEGTGIGLALVRKVVQRMGGRCGVESEPDHGSQFWVELPRSP